MAWGEALDHAQSRPFIALSCTEERDSAWCFKMDASLEYYSAMGKIKKILPFTITWVDLEGIILMKYPQRDTV